jgi:radical SAM protein with 4Fe4S-binding SPASM domain
MDNTKALWHMERIMDHYDKGKRIPPVHIDMGIAKFCNIKCVFCYGLFQTPAPVFIQRDALLQTMRDAGEIGVKSIGIIGDGEPTCNPHLYEALEEGKKAGLDLSLSTNGILIKTDEQRECILRNCKWMRFCLSAGSREGYKKIHGFDLWEKAIQSVKDMVRVKKEKGYECDIGLQAVFVPTLMAEEMVKEAQLAVDLGVDYFVIKQCSLPDEENKSGMMNFDLTDYDKPEIIDALKRAESLSTDKTKIIVKWEIIKQKGNKPYQGCLSIPLISEMSGNGDWYPCGYMFGENSKFKDEYRFGNVHQISLKDMFNSDRYWNIIEKMKKFDVHNDCAGCCRMDKCNEFIFNYLNKPKGINFI